ncbi:MAG: molybdopterin dehydrogenase FAD-binding protein, partial [Deltaproteobacteria bacterium]|nr:molybdopterin dehydrogenase FAD-binding protein [Deltaproteobacteria bacterium]
MLPEFASVIPESKEKALTYLSSLDKVKVFAGGTDLLVKMRRGETCNNIVDITGIPDLKGISQHGSLITIGAASTHKAISTHPIVRSQACSLAIACGWVGSPAIRNMGTIGGNLVNASPAAESLAPLLIHDAEVVLESNDGMRRMKVEDFILAPYKTAINTRELLTVIEIKGLSGYREGYKRVTKRAAWAISRLSIAWAILEEAGVFRDVKIAIGSCTPMPFRPNAIEASLQGKAKSVDIIRTAVEGILEEIKRI